MKECGSSENVIRMRDCDLPEEAVSREAADRADIELREIGQEWDTTWDALVSQSASSGFMQSMAWAAFKQAEGYAVRRYGLFEAGELCGGGTLLFYPMQGGAGFVVCPEGPVLPWHDTQRARAGLRLLIARARALAEEFGAIGLRIEPHLTPPRPSLLRNWSRAPIDLLPVHTLMLDLSQTDETLLAQMHPKGRYNLKLAARHGVSVRMSTDTADLAGFYVLFQETALRHQFFAEPYAFFLNLGATHFPTGCAALFLAEWNAEIVSAILVVFYGRRATYLYGGSALAHRAVMPNYQLQWAAIQESRKRGCIEYDFYGYDPFGLPDHPYAGFSRFKSQFGGRHVANVGAYDLLFYDRIADRLIERFRSA